MLGFRRTAMAVLMVSATSLVTLNLQPPATATLANGGLETGSVSPWVARSGSSPTLAVVTTPVHSGTKSLRATFPVMSANSGTGVCYPFTLQTGHSYTMSVWTRGDLPAQIRTNNLTQAQVAPAGSTWTKLTHSWTQYYAVTRVCVVSEAAATTAGKKLYLDDLDVTEIPTPGFFAGETRPNNGLPPASHSAVGGNRSYWNLSEASAAISYAQADLAAGRIPVMSFKLDDTWAQAAAGSVDTEAKALANGLAALGGPVYVGIHHEPEGDGDITEWTAMQEHLSPLFDQGQLRFIIILTGYHQLYGNAQYSLDSLWPASPAPIKGFAVDVYQSYLESGDNWTNLQTAYWDQFGDWAAAHEVEWGEAEAGLSNAAWTQRPEAPAWFGNNIDGVEAAGGTFFLYFNVMGQSSLKTWPLGTGTTKEAAFLAALP